MIQIENYHETSRNDKPLFVSDWYHIIHTHVSFLASFQHFLTLISVSRLTAATFLATLILHHLLYLRFIFILFPFFINLP